MSDSLKLFSRISWAEGISFLVLLFIAMPLKYGLGMAMAVKIVGWAHGVLFILYFGFGLQAAKAEGWGMKTISVAVLASVIPFGPFVLERHLSLSKGVG